MRGGEELERLAVVVPKWRQPFRSVKKGSQHFVLARTLDRTVGDAGLTPADRSAGGKQRRRVRVQCEPRRKTWTWSHVIVVSE